MKRQTKLGWVAAAFFQVASVHCTYADSGADLKACEIELQRNFAVRHVVVWPSNRFGVSCGGGGPGECSIEWTPSYDKIRIATEAGLSNPSDLFIENAISVDRDVTGDASADVSFDANSVKIHFRVHKGWFGGGATSRTRVQVTFRRSDSDVTIETIGRLCAAKVFGQAPP